MRLKLIACKALFRELSYLSALSENAIDITWVRQGCHDFPEQLHDLLQEEIDRVEEGTDMHTNKMLEDAGSSGLSEDFDAILIGYGLCSNATLGLKAKNHRLVIPKAHDCITLFLGSKERYADYFENLPGCFWYTASWMESTDLPSKKRVESNTKIYEELGYDEETISYLITELGGLNNYQHAAYISMPFLKNNEKYRKFTNDAADYFEWNFHNIEGDMKLLERFITGNWNEEDFLVLEPGETAAASFDTAVIKKA